MQKCAKKMRKKFKNGAKMKKSFQMFARAVWKDKLILWDCRVFGGFGCGDLPRQRAVV